MQRHMGQLLQKLLKQLLPLWHLHHLQIARRHHETEGERRRCLLLEQLLKQQLLKHLL